MSDFPSPLPLVAFEEYMLWDDRPNYPMSIIARLRFTGQLDRRAAAEALETAVARHPLLRATIRKTPAGRMEWIAAGQPAAMAWIDGSLDERLPSMRPIDLFSEPGLRVWAAADSQRSSLVVQAHHAACDGKGVVQLLDDFVRCYARLADGKGAAIELPPCTAEALRGRGTFGLTALKFLRILPAQISGLLGAWQFFVRRPVPLLAAGEAVAGELPGSFPDVKVGRLEAAELRALSAAAAESKVTVNDWLLRDFFVAVHDFRTRHQAPAAREWISFAVPIDLRQAADREMPAANVVSMVFIQCTPAQIADPARLLHSIHAEMNLILRRRLGLTFVLSLLVLRWLPGGLSSQTKPGRCEATCVLSNLGRVMADSPLPRCDEKIVAGNVVLEGVDFFAPVRDSTSVTVGLVFYAGGLQICMQYDRRRISESQAGDLLETYVRRIRTSPDVASRAVQAGAA
jgi:NRPS condensation-like uncharacterized protein